MNAGLTQELAAELLHISIRTLSDYENGHTQVADDIVAAMADLYNSPILAWWHLRETSVLGKFLPEIITPQTNGDMAFQVILAQDELAAAVTGIKQIMSDGEISSGEKVTYRECIELIKNANGKLFSVIAYAKKEVD